MSNNNTINLSEDQLDKPIYRIFPVGRFLQVLTSKKLTLVKPKKWDDPFENLMLSSKFKIGGSHSEISARDSVYGQCWTLHRETDAMWRIYSANKDAVRLRSTPRKLLEALMSSNPEFAEIKCFVGGVQYVSKAKLKDAFSKINVFNTNGSGIAESLLIKRTEFSHEKEVRLVYVGDDGSCGSDIFEFDVDPSIIFDRVLFDPRMSGELRKSYIATVRALGYHSEIKRSTLYDPPVGLTFGN